MFGIQKRVEPILALLWATQASSCWEGRKRWSSFLEFLWSFKTSTFLWEPEIWQVCAVIDCRVGVSWTDAFRIIHQGPVCRAVNSLRFPSERERKHVETSLFSKWANGGSRGRQLVTEAEGSEVSTVSEQATSTRSPFPIFLSGTSRT
jgi:hypothetical protein